MQTTKTHATPVAKTQWSPVVEELKVAVNSLSTDKAQKLLSLVCKLESVLSFTRQYYPKLFTITRKGDVACLQEEIVDSGQPPLYCFHEYYDAIAKAVANMSGQTLEFDREGLHNAARQVNNRVTKPAVIACIRFWMSIPEPLLLKNMTTNKYDSNVDPSLFVEEATVEWESLSVNPLRLERPRPAQKFCPGQ